MAARISTSLQKAVQRPTLLSRFPPSPVNLPRMATIGTYKVPKVENEINVSGRSGVPFLTRHN